MTFTTTNSYAYHFTKHLQEPYIIIEKIHTTVDKIVLTRVYTSLEDIHNQLIENGKTQKDTGTRRKDGTVDVNRRLRTYRLHGKEIAILYTAYLPENLPQDLSIIIHEPDHTIMEEVDVILQILNTSPSVSKIELAWDFYTNQAILLKMWFRDHLWLCYNRKGCSTYKDYDDDPRYKNTDYISNPRDSTKGIRVYPRPIGSSPSEYLRLELQLNRPVIRKMGIKFPLTPSQLSIDYKKFFRFCCIDYDRLVKSYLRHLNADRYQINHRATHPLRRHAGALYQQQLSSDITSIQRNKLTLVEKMASIKKLGLSNHTRFLKPLEELERIISELACAQGFSI